MHTFKVITAGIALLAALTAIEYVTNGTVNRKLVMTIFLPIWLGLSLLNMYFGMKRAGYSAREELPVLLLVFLVPSIIAFAVYFRS